jgi:hypothetical protein
VSTDIYKDLLRDVIAEINKVANEELNTGGSEFERGYRAGMMVVMKAFQDEISAFGLSESLELIDVDAWFRGESDSQVS